MEKLQHEVIIGIEGERVVNSRDFYSMFTTEINLKVVNAGNTVGEIPYSPQLIDDENIFLAARIWKIIKVDFDPNKIDVVPAKDGKKPKFSGGAAAVHPRIRHKMFEILFRNDRFEQLDQASLDEIETMRKEFSVFKIQNTEIERPLLIHENKVELFTFTGTKINRTIDFLLNLAEVKFIFDARSSSFELVLIENEFFEIWNSLSKFLPESTLHIEGLLQPNPAVLGFSKWGNYLPVKFQVALVKDTFFDFAGAEQLLTDCKIVKNI